MPIEAVQLQLPATRFRVRCDAPGCTETTSLCDAMTLAILLAAQCGWQPLDAGDRWQCPQCQGKEAQP